MSTRITRSDLEQSVKVLANRLGVPYYPEWHQRFFSPNNALLLDYQTGGYRVHQLTENGKGERNISPRLSAKELDLWLSGAITALDMLK